MANVPYSNVIGNLQYLVPNLGDKGEYNFNECENKMYVDVGASKKDNGKI
jgi:hypothetical protein